MAATSQNFHLFATQVIQTAVLNSEKSKVFFRKLIPTAIASIIYERTELNRDDFNTHHYKNITYHNFKTKINNAVLKGLCELLKGAIEAVNKNYLRELYLMFINISTSEVLESYKIKFKYVQENSMSSDTEATKDSLKRSTMELLQSIEKLNTFEDVLKESEVLPQICITYYEEVTPLDYQPPGFRSPDASSQNMMDVISDMSKNPMIMGVLKTGFHTMQCLGKFARIREESDSTDISLGENERIPLSQITDQISDLEVTPKNQLSTNLKKDSGLGDNLQVDCLCLINGKFENISLIECTNCTFLEHAPCVGYLEASDVEEPYYCQKCKYITSTSSTPRDLRRQHVLAIYRLSLTYMYLNKVFPSEVLNNVKESVRLLIVKRLSLLKVIEETADGYLLVNEEILKPSIKKLFENTLARIKSKNVITSEENEDVSPAKKIKIA